MSEETINHQDHPGRGTEFEREDMSTRAVFMFMIGLALVGLVIYFIIVGMYSFLDKYERSQMTPSSPLAASTEVSSRAINYAPGQGDYIDRKFKDNGAPLLEHDERSQFKDFLLKQEQQLNSYGWVDEQAGVAHIPIERAMELTVERGLPVLPQGASEAKPPAVSKAAAAPTVTAKP